MVVLVPILDGEAWRTCRCGMLGIVSPIPERSGFYPRTRDRRRFQPICRRCEHDRSVAYQREWQPGYVRRRRAELRKDPEAWEAYQAKQREYNRRYRERKGRDAIRAQQQRHLEAHREEINARAWARRDPARVETVAAIIPGSTSRKGELYPAGPLRAWIRGLMARACVEYGLEEGAGRDLVAAWLGVSGRRVWGYLNEMDEVYESVVDRLTAREGSVTVWDLYPDGAGTVLSPVAVRGVVRDGPERLCVSPGCGEAPKDGSRFCSDHAERLAGIREFLERTSRPAARGRFSGSAPRCCGPGCDNPRARGERFCPVCADEREHEEGGNE